MKNKTALLLMELAVLVGVFALTTAMCLRLFAWADTTAREDALRDTALLHAHNAAQEIKLARGDLKQAARQYGGIATEAVWELPLEDGCLLRAEKQARTDYLGVAQITVLAGDGSVLIRLDACWQEDGP